MRGLRSFQFSWLMMALLTVLVGCGTDKPKSAVKRTGPRREGGWKGSYVTSPAEFESRHGLAYAQLLFLRKGDLQVILQDRQYPSFVFVSAVAATKTQPEAVDGTCRSTVLFYDKGDGAPAQLVYSQARGKEGQWKVDGDLLKAGQEFLQHSHGVKELVPAPLLQCSGVVMKLKRSVNKDKELEISLNDGERTHHFTTVEATAFRDVVSRLPQPKAEPKLWKVAQSLPGLAPSAVVQDPKNDYLPPVPGTHIYYHLPKLTFAVGSAFYNADKGVFVIPWTKGKRPADPRSMGELSRALWVEAIPVSVTVFYGKEKKFVEEKLPAEAFSGEKAELTVQGRNVAAFETEPFTVKIGYALEAGKPAVLWQQVVLSTEKHNIKALAEATYELQ